MLQNLDKLWAPLLIFGLVSIACARFYYNANLSKRMGRAGSLALLILALMMAIGTINNTNSYSIASSLYLLTILVLIITAIKILRICATSSAKLPVESLKNNTSLVNNLFSKRVNLIWALCGMSTFLIGILSWFLLGHFVSTRFHPSQFLIVGIWGIWVIHILLAILVTTQIFNQLSNNTSKGLFIKTGRLMIKVIVEFSKMLVGMGKPLASSFPVTSQVLTWQQAQKPMRLKLLLLSALWLTWSISCGLVMGISPNIGFIPNAFLLFVMFIPAILVSTARFWGVLP